MKLDIILINYNSGKSLLDCINSVFNSTDINFEDINLTVVDNGSTDGSVEKINHLQSVNIIENSKNLGYGKACNIGLRKTNNKFVLLLNPDTLLPKESLSKSIRFINDNNQIDILGVKQLDDNNKIQKGCCRKPNLINALNTTLGLYKIHSKIFKSYKMLDWDHRSSGKMFHAIGSFWMFRRVLLDQIGYFDEDFFLYYEDLDYSRRLNKVGKHIYYNSEIFINHKGGGSSQEDISKRLYYSLKNRNLYFKKHFNLISYLIISLVMILIEPVIRILISIFTLNFINAIYTIKGYLLMIKYYIK